MPGLFDKIGDVMQQPAAQGLLGAAALGFNPALGLLAVPALRQAQQTQQQARTAADQELEERAMALAQQRRQQQAAERLPRLLNSAPPAVGTMDGGMVRPGMDTYRERQVGLLSQIAPQAAATGLLQQAFPQQQRAEPSAIRTMRALGIPETPEGFQQFSQLSAQGGTANDQLGAILKRLQIEQMLGEQARGREREREGERLASIDTGNLIQTGESIVGRALALEGTLLEPGAPFIESRRAVTSGLGFLRGIAGDTEGSDQAVRQTANLDTLKKDAQAFALTLANQLGRDSSRELEAVEESFANQNMTVPAILSSVAREASASLDKAEAKGIRVPNIDSLRQQIDMMKRLSRMDQSERLKERENMSLRRELQERRQRARQQGGGL